MWQAIASIAGFVVSIFLALNLAGVMSRARAITSADEVDEYRKYTINGFVSFMLLTALQAVTWFNLFEGVL